MDLNVRLKWIHRDTDRHGNVRVYFWRRRAKAGPKIRIQEEPGSEAFLVRYRDLVALSEIGVVEAVDTPASERTALAVQARTFGWLVKRYMSESSNYLALEASGRRTRRGVLEHMLDERVVAGEPETFRDFPLHRMTTRHLRVLRDRKGNAGLPGAANNRVRALRGLFKWAADDEDGDPIIDRDLAAKVARVDDASTGWHTWSEAEVQQYEQRHGRGTKARLALALLLYTGVRRSDVVGLGKQHETMVAAEPWLQKRQVKGRRRRVTMIEVPLLPVLADEIAAGSSGHLTYLVTEYGQPFTVAGFGNWFRERCNEAGLQHCSAHGLRKAGAVRAAENGATTMQLMAIFGWRNMKEAEVYTKAAERRKMARAAMGLLARDVKG